MTTKKTTKKAKFAVVRDILNWVQDKYALPEDMTYEDMFAFVDHEIELLDGKAASAQKRAAAKKQEGDALREKVYDVLTDDFMTIDEIVAAVDDPQVTRNMVTSRLAQLSELDRVERDTVAAGEDGKGRKIAAYRRK